METLQRSLAELAGTITCHYCHAPLGEERAVANTRDGPRWFCKSDSENPQDSCYLQWKRMSR